MNVAELRRKLDEIEAGDGDYKTTDPSWQELMGPLGSFRVLVPCYRREEDGYFVYGGYGPAEMIFAPELGLIFEQEPEL